MKSLFCPPGDSLHQIIPEKKQTKIEIVFTLLASDQRRILIIKMENDHSKGWTVTIY